MNRLILLLLVLSPAVAQTPAPLSPTPPAVPHPQPPSSPAGPVPENEIIPEWQARWEMAQSLSYVKRYDESLAEYRKLLAQRPEDVAIRQDYGQVLLWSGQPQAAVTELQRIPAAQRTPAATVALADALLAGHDYDAAERLYRTRLQAAPDDQSTRLKLAEVLSWSKRFDDSLALYREILTARPDDAQVRRHYAEVLLWAGKPDEAAAEFRRTLPE